MYSDEDLDAAVAAGILTEESATAFRTHVAALRRSSAADEEQFRLITGFNDIFVVIAVALLLSALYRIGSAVTQGFGMFIVAAASWGLAEFFVRKRRMALPAIVLFLTFQAGSVLSVFYTAQGLSFSFIAASLCAAIAAWA
ncbi:MAG: hypothetical protein ACU84J_12895, partial [Gammaproteobacteria bacterium]